jgi:hypothetical protein
MTLGYDYIKCALCTFVGTRIMGHVTKVHGLDRATYEARHGRATAAIVRDRYSKANAANGDWVTRAKTAGVDLTERMRKMGESVRARIMSDPDERMRRSKLAQTTIVAYARSEEGREKSSQAAQETSARPEIITARAAQLAAWRARCPDEFHEKCVAAMHSFKTTKPEWALLAFLQAQFPCHEFKGNQRITALCFVINKSRKRQIDIMSHLRKIIVEFDGPLHFMNIESWDQLQLVQAKDRELDDGATALGYLVIRVGCDMVDKRTGEPTDECKAALRDAVANGRLGECRRIGRVYA